MILGFDTNPVHTASARQLYELDITELMLPEGIDITAVEYLPDKTIIFGTAQGSVFHYNVQTQSVLTRLDTPAGNSASTSVNKLLLTAMHLICVKSNDLYFYELNDENEQIRVVGSAPQKKYNFKHDNIVEIFYNQDMTDMIVLTANAFVYTIPIKAEKREDIEGDDDVENKRSSKPVVSINSEAHFVGVYHNTRVIMCEEIPGTNYLVSVSEAGVIILHDLTTGLPQTHLQIQANLTCAAIGPYGNMLFLGSQAGCIRVVDISEFKKTPRVIYCKKLHTTKAIRTIRISPDHSMLAFLTEDSSKAFMMSAEPANDFELYGFCRMPGTVLDIGWLGNLKGAPDAKRGKHMLIVIIKNGMLAGIVPPKIPTPSLTLKEFKAEDLSLRARRIDFDITMGAVDQENGEVICTGELKMHRKYKIPEDRLQDVLDMNIRAADAPLRDSDGHDLLTNFITCKPGIESFISGGQDGTIIKRDCKSLSEQNRFNAHSFLVKGVSTCSASDKYPIVYSGGFDGTLFVYKEKDFNFDKDKSRAKEVPGEFSLASRAELSADRDEEVKYYEIIIEEDSRRAREKEKHEIQANMKEKLFIIKQRLRKLIAENEKAEDIEKIDRDEYCLDIELRDRLLREGDKDVDQIKQDAYYKNLREELVHNKIKSLTFAKVDTHLKTLTGLVQPILVFNFVIRKKEEDENQRYRLMSNLRSIEINEKKWTKDKAKEDIIDLPTLVALPENFKAHVREMRAQAIVNLSPAEIQKYDNDLAEREAQLRDFLEQYPDTRSILSKPDFFICNLKPGRMKMLLLDHIKREEDRQKTKAAAMEYDQKVVNQENLDASDRPTPHGYRAFRLNRKPIGKKKLPGANAKDDNLEGDNDEQTDQEGFDDEEGTKDFDMMYGALELFTTKRKKIQMQFLKNIIFKIKRSFNKEFEVFCKYRTKEIEKINEYNFIIGEILAKLNQPHIPFAVQHNIIENPKAVLNLEDKEVPFQKYLTRKERKEADEKRLKEEQRLKALSKDDAGNRA